MSLDKKTKYRYDSYDWDEEQDIIRIMQRCQRNWDYTKQIPDEVVNRLLWVAANSPSKQHEAYYDVYYTTDRTVIADLYQHTWGNTQSRNPPANARNSQMNANMYMVFVTKQPPTMQNSSNSGLPLATDEPERYENAVVSVGIAMGLVMRTAIKNGLVTGCNKSNGNGPDHNNYWEKRLGIYEDACINNTKQILYGIGIGYPQENRPRWESDDLELCIGASNGHNLTAQLQENSYSLDNDSISENPPREVKIVNIAENKEAVDPHGAVHQLPETIEFAVHSSKPRNINVIEIK